MSDGSDCGKFRKVNAFVENTISTMKEQNAGIIPALEILQVGYNEMKEHLNETSSVMPPTTIVNDIIKGLAGIEKIFTLDPIIDEQEEIDLCDDKPDTSINTKRRELKKKAFKGKTADVSVSPKKNISMRYRTSITDDGEFLKIAKAPVIKPKKSLNQREIKTVIKQLEPPM